VVFVFVLTVYAPRLFALSFEEQFAAELSKYNSIARPLTVSIYLLNKKLANVQIVKTGESIKFSQPQELASIIDYLVDKKVFIRYLSRDLAANSDKACLTRGQKKCGVLPNVAEVEVIYNEAKVRLDLLINKKYLDFSISSKPKNLPLPNSGLTSVLGVNSAAYLSDTASNMNVALNHILGFKEYALYTSANYTGDALELSNFYAQRQLNDVVYKGLFFNVENLRMSGVQLFGISMYSSLTATTNTQAAYQEKLQILIEKDSVVKIFKDNHLIHSQYYKLGFHEIDGAFLPNGAYDLTIEIIDSLGNTSTRSQFFVKLAAYPPLETPLYWLDAGLLVSSNQISSVSLVRLGKAQRLKPNLALTSNIIASSDYSLAESSIDYHIGYIYVSSGILVTSGADYRVKGSMGFSYRGMSMSANISSTHADEQEYLDAQQDEEIVDLGKLDKPSLDNISQSSVSASFNLGFSVLGYSISMPYSYTQQGSEQSSYTYGLNINFPSWNYREVSIGLSSSFLTSEDAPQALINLSISSNLPYDANFAHTSTYDSVIGDIATNNRLAWSYDKSLNTNLAYSTIKRNNQSLSAYTLSSKYKNNLGRYNYTYASNYASNTSHSINFGFNVLSSANAIAIGSSSSGMSGAIVRVNAPEDGAEFLLRVNNVKKGVFPVNTNIPILLAPYAQYTFIAEQTGDKLASFISKDSEHKVVLFPGNVIKRTWNYKAQVILSGSLVDAQGKPIVGGLIASPMGFTFTRELGAFFFSGLWEEGFEVELADGSTCKVSFPKGIKFADLVDLGKLMCKH
jgi:hypothetical protein